MFLARNGRGLRPRPGASRLVAKRQKRRSVAELEGKIPSRSLVAKRQKRRSVAELGAKFVPASSSEAKKSEEAL